MTDHPLESLRELLAAAAQREVAAAALVGAARRVEVCAGEVVLARGALVDRVHVVEVGLLSLRPPDAPTRWAPRGAVLGLAATLAGETATGDVIAARHSVVWVVPVAGLVGALEASGAGVPAVARLARTDDLGLVPRTAEHSVALVLLVGCSPDQEAAVAEALAEAADDLAGVDLIPRSALDPAGADVAAQLACAEEHASMAVHLATAEDEPRAALLLPHADRILLVLPAGPMGPMGASLAGPIAKEALTRANRARVELVYLREGTPSAEVETVRGGAPVGAHRAHIMEPPLEGPLRLLLGTAREELRGDDALRAFPLLEDLDERELAWVGARLAWSRVDGGACLVRQGDAGDAAWLIRSGRFHVTSRAGDDEERTVAWLGPGDIVGELALLTEHTRTASVWASRDGVVARLDRDAMDSLLRRAPRFASAVARTVAERLSGGPSGSGPRSDRRWARTLAVVALGPEPDGAGFARALAATLAGEGVTVRLLDAGVVDAEVGRGASLTRRGDVGDADLVAWLDGLERGHDALVLVCQDQPSPWTRRCLRQADDVLLVADAAGDPGLRPVEAALTPPGERVFARRHLVLRQPAGIAEAQGTAAWLAPREVVAHHHLRDGHAEDLERLARRVVGRAVGVAFSGASSRAPGHLGVVRAAAELGLPIDVVSGSSSGAGIAALVAAGFSAAEALEHAVDIIARGAPSLRQMQPPYTALTSGKAPDRALQAVFGDRRLEDQLIQASVCAVDIRRHALVQLRRGLIWEAVRASGSLPMVWPPVWRDDALLVDGGIMSYLPVEGLAPDVAGGLTLASNLDPTAGRGVLPFADSLRYGTRVSGWRQLLRRLVRAKGPRPPAIADILFHAMAILSFQEQAGLAALAARDDVCMLTPELGQFGLFEVGPEAGRRLEAAAWEHAREALTPVAERWRARR